MPSSPATSSSCQLFQNEITVAVGGHLFSHGDPEDSSWQYDSEENEEEEELEDAE